MGEREKTDTTLSQAVHMIGNAHLDPVWLWRWQEGYAEIKATFRSALDRMNEFPDFIFTCAGAAYYEWVEQNAPDMFEEIRRRVNEGRWVIVGGWWIQPDCNLPSGESFARHSLYSQRYFREKFGRIAQVGYNVDSFGHHGMLPQILKLSGMDAYVFSRPGVHEKTLPEGAFWWESADGSRVIAYRIPIDYCTGPGGEVVAKTKAIAEMAARHGSDQMCFYGVGNHGGGPTVVNLREIVSLQQNSPEASIVFSSPDAFFRKLSVSGTAFPVVRDDLQHHAVGCYTAHSETKADNRAAEHRLLTAEKFAAVAHRLVDFPYDSARLEDAWRRVMFNQFHDIMGGCSIKEAYRDSREAFGYAGYISAVTLNGALQKLSWSIDTMREGIVSVTRDKDRTLWEQNNLGVPFVVFNPHSWAVTAPVVIPQQMKGVTDNSDVPVAMQYVRASRTNGGDKFDTLFIAELPPLGYRVYWIYREKTFDVPAPVTPPDQALNDPDLTVTATVMENRYVRLELEKHTGYIKRLLDKRTGKDVISGNGAVPVVLDEFEYDTWAHHATAFRSELGKFADASIEMIETGPLRGRIRVTSRYGQSVIRQDFMLHRDRPDVEVTVKLDWRERHKMLKLSFPVRLHKPEATYEIPYGYIERPANGEEEPGQQWLDLSGEAADGSGRCGLALLNDSKYGYDVLDNEMRMSVVRGAIFADHYGRRDDLCEYMDQGIQEFHYALVPHAGSWREAGIVRKAYELNVRPEHVIETYHKGELPQVYEGIRIDSAGIVAVAFKKAEDGDGYILRCCETSGTDTRTTIELPMLGRKWEAGFGKLEIKTFRIPLDPLIQIEETDLLETAMITQ
ncbi:alpha-mannosidase [Paenibacillus ginsengarvi]|nr:alpha-mannosidase [Paenibacillus ginsengarvi]